MFKGLHEVHLRKILPWLVWLSGLSARLRTKRLPVRIPVRDSTWIAGQVPCWVCVESLVRQGFSPSLSPVLPFSLK